MPRKKLEPPIKVRKVIYAFAKGMENQFRQAFKNGQTVELNIENHVKELFRDDDGLQHHKFMGQTITIKIGVN
jgi:hypothetical protein